MGREDGEWKRNLKRTRQLKRIHERRTQLLTVSSLGLADWRVASTWLEVAEKLVVASQRVDVAAAARGGRLGLVALDSITMVGRSGCADLFVAVELTVVAFRARAHHFASLARGACSGRRVGLVKVFSRSATRFITIVVEFRGPLRRSLERIRRLELLLLR